MDNSAEWSCQYCHFWLLMRICNISSFSDFFCSRCRNENFGSYAIIKNHPQKILTCLPCPNNLFMTRQQIEVRRHKIFQVMNGRFNCGENDTSDEDFPLPRCHADEFRCRINGQCLPREYTVNNLVSALTSEWFQSLYYALLSSWPPFHQLVLSSVLAMCWYLYHIAWTLCFTIDFGNQICLVLLASLTSRPSQVLPFRIVQPFISYTLQLNMID